MYSSIINTVHIVCSVYLHMNKQNVKYLYFLRSFVESIKNWAIASKLIIYKYYGNLYSKAFLQWFINYHAVGGYKSYGFLHNNDSIKYIYYLTYTYTLYICSA